MLLKLVVPHINWMIQEGSIVMWHKAEGERVTYGEDLFDLEIQLGSRAVRALSERIERLTQGEAKPLEVQDLLVMDENPGPTFLVRITASDVGTLRRICARQGSWHSVGSVVALLTTDEHEPIDHVEATLARASVFRVVANTL